MNIPFTTETILIIILFLALAIITYVVFRLDNKLRKFLVNEKAETLSDSISTMEAGIRGLENFKDEVEKYLVSVEKRLKKSTQGIYTVRFNPFKGTTGSGGNQSFATAFLNESGDGVVVSSLYAREHVSIFAKPVVNGASEYELSDEEAQAIKEALKLVK